MVLLSAHQIEKSFAHRTLFEKIHLGIDEKERIGLVGPNGAGKSTLLKILAGEVEADGGTVSRKRGLRLGFLDQSPTFLPKATILSSILEKSTHPEESLPLALSLIARLDLAHFGQEHLVHQLSGGWQKRVALARALAAEPQLLFLDEPTNHLDTSSILWLEEHLRAAPFALLMVTHDRLFLQRVTNRILDLDPRNPNYLLSVAGDYSKYLEIKAQELAALQRHEQVEKNRLRRETEWLRRGAQARQTKQSARIEAAATLQETVQDLRTKNKHRQVDLGFGEREHSPKKLIEANGISKRFGEHVLFENLDILLTPQTRLGLMGDNGCGKSTLIKVLLGLETPDAGQIKRAEGIEIAYFEQSRETLRLDWSVLKNICPEGDYVFFQGQSVHVRSYLDRFFFSGSKVDLMVQKLSGGEQARLRLAQLMLKQSQVLVLDEPTNDLDTDMLDSLEAALKDYAGAVILVSHDRYFLDAVTSQILAFPLTGSQDRRLQKFAGYFQWEQWFRADRAGSTKSSKAESETKSAPPRVRLSFKEKFELDNMEATILRLEGEVEELKHKSQVPEVLADHRRLAEVHSQIAVLQAELDQKYQRWTELEARK